MQSNAKSGDQPKAPAPDSASGWKCFDTAWLTSPSVTVAGLAYALGGLVALCILIAGLLILIQFIGEAVTTAPKDFEDVSKRLLAVGVLIAAPFAIWRIIISHWQARAAQAQAEAANQQAATSREAHFTTLFTKAIELLGSTRQTADAAGAIKSEPNMEVRLGAIYALERIARDSTRDHWPIMETLCAYVRENAGPPQMLSTSARNSVALHRMMGARSSLNQESKLARQQRLRADIQAALTVLGRRSTAQIEHEASLREEAVRKEWHGLDLRRTNLTGAVLDGLHFDYARFDGSSLAFASFQDTHLRHANFANAGLEGAEFARSKLAHANIAVTHAEGARFPDADMQKVNAQSAQLLCAVFERSNLQDASFAVADLLGAIIAPSNAKGAAFIQSKLTLAVFRGLSMEGVILSRDVSLKDVFFTQVELQGAKNITPAMLNDAIADMRTTTNGRRLTTWPQSQDEFLERVGREREQGLKAKLIVCPDRC
jgi:uncharacterized protein YjbI with pentapeptide repeats